jgi:NCAIR mutase (PurE)-related protein
VDPREVLGLLEDVKAGRLAPRDAAHRLATLPFEDLGFARLDHHRALRKGFPEVVFGGGKTPEQIAIIVEAIASRGQNSLVTRASREAAAAVVARVPCAVYHETALKGGVAVVCAGTSDIPVAEEAAITAEFHGAVVERIRDVGVAGLHRLLDRAQAIRQADVVIVVAGMEGALPSVVGGLVEAPVIAVPTSVGYGAAFQGLAALLAMLNSCAPGVAVVNIDNGFGAGYLAATILRRRPA